jgi:hypothetical protein
MALKHHLLGQIVHVCLHGLPLLVCRRVHIPLTERNSDGVQSEGVRGMRPDLHVQHLHVGVAAIKQHVTYSLDAATHVSAGHPRKACQVASHLLQIYHSCDVL